MGPGHKPWQSGSRVHGLTQMCVSGFVHACTRVCVYTYVKERGRKSSFKDRRGDGVKHMAPIVPLQKIFPDQITAPRATIMECLSNLQFFAIIHQDFSVYR